MACISSSVRRSLLSSMSCVEKELIGVGYGWYSQQSNERLAALNGLKFSVWTSRGAGLVLAFDGAMILVPSAFGISGISDSVA